MEQSRRQDDKKIDTLAERFDRHLEIYALNGKELAGVKVEVKTLGTDIGHLRTDMAKDIAGLMSSIEKITTTFVTKDQFSPVKNLVYGVVAIILTAVVTAGVSFLIAQRSQANNDAIIKAAVKSAIDEYNVTLK